MSAKIDKWMQQARGALRAGDRAAALDYLAKILDKAPRHLDARYLIGTLLAEAGSYVRAREHLEAAARLAPDSPYIQNNLGNVYLLSSHLDAAEKAFRVALRLAPELFEALTNLGNLLVRRGALEEAIAVAGRAAAARPEHAAAQVTLANALKDQGRCGEALEHYRHAAQLAPGNTAVQSNLLMALNYVSGMTPDQIADAHRDWGLRFAPAAAPRARSGGGPLRVGYLSPDFGRHPVGYLIDPVLAAADHDLIHVALYSDTPHPDDLTARLRAHADAWRDLHGLSDDQAAAVILADQPDILVDLAGHGAGNRLALFGRRLAAVQVSYLGYPATTGLAAMDYVITDGGLDPEDEPPNLYTERLWRLPRPCFAFRPDADFPPVSELPAQVPGAITFGSFNALAKISDEVIELWSAVLLALPQATLLMQARALSDEGSRRRLVDRFRTQGVAPDRIEMLGFTSLPEHLALFQRTDICLDTFPWNGHMTTLDSLWMGVPVLTLAGDRHAAHMGESTLRTLGMDDYVATSGEDFVARAVAAAMDLDRLAVLRAGLRARLEASPLADGAGLARALESAYLDMHQAAVVAHAA